MAKLSMTTTPRTGRNSGAIRWRLVRRYVGLAFSSRDDFV